MRRPVLLFAPLACTLFLAFALAPRTASARQLSTAKAASAATLEQEVINEINFARTRPAEYAAYLERLRPYFSGKEYRRPGKSGLLTEEGAAALEEAISFLRSARPAAALSLSQGMCSGAHELVKDQSATGATGHRGTDGSFCEQRAQRFGSWKEPIGENLSYGDDDARERVITLLIDDGFASRGHRQRLLDPTYKVAGVACGKHKLGQMCVITLAGGFNDGAAKVPQPAAEPSAVPSGARRF